MPYAALFAFALLVAVAACGGYEIPVIRRGSTIAARLLLAGFLALVPWFEQRHRSKPGLAGWAQLNAPYAADLATTGLKLAYDLYYLRHWSLAFDLAILLRTFQVVVWGQGAR